MKRACVVLAGLFCIAAAEAQQKDSKQIQAMLAGTPLSFEPNVGQNPSPTKFTARGGGYFLELGSTGAAFRLAGRDSAEARVVTMDLAGASSKAEIRGEQSLPGTVSYSRTSDPKTWFKNIPTYKSVHYSGVYPGIDMSYYGAGARVEYDFIVAPGADASRIRMKMAGGDKISLTESGDLVFALGKNDFRLLRPVAYQIAKDGKHENVEASYLLSENGNAGMVGLKLGKYDRSRKLIIDPVAVTTVALNFSEYTAQTYLAGIAVDSSGNAYVTGYDNNSPYGFYVTKYNTTGVAQWTMVVGTGSLAPLHLVVDSSKNVDIAGTTNNTGVTLPTSAASFQTTVSASNTGFFVQVNSTGSAVNYATFLSGTETYNTAALGVAVDSTGKVYVGGWTYSATLKTTAGVYQSTFSGNPGSNYNGWMAKFNPAGSSPTTSLVYLTYLGGSNSEVFGVAADSSGNAYAASNATNSATFPVTSGAFQYTGYQSANGGAYVSKLNSTATALSYSAYLGYGTPYGITVDGSGDAYVAGTVSFEDWPTTSGAYNSSYYGGFAVELNPAGSSEIYSTFLGGPSSIGSVNDVYPQGVALEPGCSSSCNLYVSGWTNTSDFPMVNPIATTFAGGNGFVVELAGNGASALLSTYFNGLSVGTYYGYPASSDTNGFTPAIAVDGSGNILLAGNTTGPDFPITINNAGYSPNTYVSKLIPSTSPYLLADLNQPNQIPPSVTFPNSQPVGISTSVDGHSLTLNVRNMSGVAVTGMQISTSPSDIFSESDSCGGTIAAGAYCAMTLNFTPGQPGTRSGTLTITSNASNSPFTVALNGTGYDTSYIQTSANSFTFGTQVVNTSSAAQAITLKNIGDETTPLNIYFGTGTNFSLLNGCPSQLLPGASCIISAKFTPTQPGSLTDYVEISNQGPNLTIPAIGTGVVSGNNGSINLDYTSLNFGNETVGATTSQQQVQVQNTGSIPVSFQSIVASGDYAITSQGCPVNSSGNLQPQATCNVYVTFSPSQTGTRTGALTFSDSATGSPQSVSLTGNGVAGSQTIEFYPSSTAVFGNQPVGFQSGNITVYAQNVGTSPVTFDRVTVTGDFVIYNSNCYDTTVNGVLTDGYVNYNYCYVNVAFVPSQTGFRTGTLTFIDTATGSPQTVNLQGTGTTPTGALQLYQTQLDYNTYAVGTTSPTQLVELYNPGDTPITVNGYNTGVSDFAVTNYNCGTPPFTLNSGAGCDVQVSFTPTSTANPRTGTVTITSSAGNQTVALSGNGVTASQAFGMTPASPLNFGTVVDGTTSGNFSGSGELDGVGNIGALVSIRNTGTSPITFSANTALSGTNASEFSIYNPNQCGSTSSTLGAGASCVLWVDFSPTSGATGTQTATLTFTDSAPGSPHALTLDGTASTTTPTYELTNNLVSFDNATVSTITPTTTYIRFVNNSGATVTMGNVQYSGSFLTPLGDNNCNGNSVSNGSTCYVYLNFAPTASGYQTGTVTFVNSSNTTLIAASVNGYAPAESDTVLVSPGTLNFGTDQVVGTTSGDLIAVITNTGNAPLRIGTAGGTNLGAPPTNEFKDVSDGCAGQTINPGSNCTVYINFTPNAAGTRTGTLTYTATFNDNTTTPISVSLTGVAVAEVNAAVLTPTSGAFVDQTVGTTSGYNVTVYLYNQGNLPFSVGQLTGVNAIVGSSVSGEFSVGSAQSGYDNCSHANVSAGSNCSIGVRFTPSGAGTRTGSITFPVTYANNATANLTLSLSGNGVAAAASLQVLPSALDVGLQLASSTGPQWGIEVINNGNLPVTIGTDTLSGQFAFGPSGDQCATRTLISGNNCYIYVEFVAPSTPGAQTGTLTIADNAGGHTVSLAGTVIASAQHVVLSTPAISFGNQPAGSSSAPEVIYITNQGSAISGLTWTLTGGANPGSFTLDPSGPSCGSNLGANSSCYITASFSPGASVSGAQSAQLSVNYTGSAGAMTVSLSGTATGAAPAVTPTPSPMTFPIQNVGTTSSIQRLSITNSGSASLVISTVVSSNATEFAIVSDGCSGATVAAGSFCTVGVTFSPSLGGTRTSTITITDNAGDSPESVAVAGTGFGIPQANLSPGTEPFGSVNLGSSSSQKTITLSNHGTDTLNIASITLTSGNTGDFSIPTGGTCGTTLAPGGSCTIFALFTPTVAGARGAALTVTDNATNLAGSTQSVTLSGTGVAIPQATVTGGPLAFGNQNLDTTSTARSVTVTNGGTGALSITSIVTSGPYAESDNCGQSLPAGGNCKISVLFTPTTAGAQPGSVTITDNASGSPQIVTLSGAGVGVPNGTAFTPTALTFADQNVGTTSADQTVTFSNSGTGTLTFASVAITQTSTDFAIDAGSTTCGATLAAGSSCTVAINFTPATGGGRIGTLVFTDNAGNVSGSSQSVALTGNGIGVPQATTSTGSLTFTSQNVGVTSAAKNVKITNGGTGALKISSVSLGGTNPTDFIVSANTCGTSLAIGANCSISIEFDPQGAGARTATLLISDNATNTASTQSVTLNGTGVGVPTASVSPTTVAFTNVPVQGGSGVKLSTITNTGTGPLSITAISAVTAPFTAANNCGTLPATIQPGGSCVLAIRFKPTAAGSFNTTITITDNSGNVSGTTQTVSITGSGSATAGLSPNLTFASQAVGTASAAQTVTLTNSGADKLSIASISGVGGTVFGGADPNDFLTSTTTCSTANGLGVGKSCTISVEFKPTATGTRTATLVVTDNSGGTAGTKQSVTLTGTGH